MFHEHVRLLTALRQIWSDRFPPDRPRRHTLIEKLVALVVIPVRLASLGNFVRAVRSDERRHLGMDMYVIAWAATLTSALIASQHLLWAVVLLATYRIIDIVSYRIYFLLVKSQERPWDAVAMRRSVIVVLVNLYEITVAYAMLYKSAGTLRDPLQASGPSWFQALYFSIVTSMTIGYGDVFPGDMTTRIIVIAQAMTTALLLVIIIPALVSIFASAS